MARIIAFCAPKFEVKLLSNLATPVAMSVFARCMWLVTLQGRCRKETRTVSLASGMTKSVAKIVVNLGHGRGKNRLTRN